MISYKIDNNFDINELINIVSIFISELSLVFPKESFWDSLKELLATTILTLLIANSSFNEEDIFNFLQDEVFRKSIVNKIDDAWLINYWKDFSDNYSLLSLISLNRSFDNWSNNYLYEKILYYKTILVDIENKYLIKKIEYNNSKLLDIIWNNDLNDWLKLNNIQDYIDKSNTNLNIFLSFIQK